MSLNAVSFGKQNHTTQSAYKKQVTKKQAVQAGLSNDEFLSATKDTSSKKVSFKEGLSLVGKGFVSKLKGMVTSIVKHPIKTALAIGGTSLLIAGAPLVGIASATAGAFLALGFGAYAVGKTAVDAVKTIKHNKAGKYDEVRQDLQKLGGDGLDLALSLPFAPKALKQVTRFAKYGKSTIGINSELISNLKNCNGLRGARLEFAKADTLINYEMIGNEMGLAVKPKLVFKDLQGGAEGTLFGGAYDPATGELQINQNILIGRGKALARAGGLKNTEIIMRHELEHFRQFADIARTEGIGIEGLGGTISQYYKDALKKIPVSELEKQGLSRDVINNMTRGDGSAFNSKLYQDVIDSQGVIEAGTQEAEMAAKYQQGLLEKINPSPESLAEFQEATEGINGLFMTAADRRRLLRAQMRLYKSNILEKEAFGAQDQYVADVVKGRPTAVNDVIMANNAAEKG